MATDYSLDDIHELAFEERVSAALDGDCAKLLARRDEFIATPCPACDSSRREPALNCKGFEYSRCVDCGTLYVVPCPPESLILWYLDTSEAVRMWREHKPAELVRSRQAMYRERLDYLKTSLVRAGMDARSLVEVGAGCGEFAELVVADGQFDRVIVVEPQPLELSSPGVELVHGSFESVNLTDPVDVLVAFEVLEHLVDPSRFLAMIHRCVRPGGVVLLTMPNGQGFEIEILRERSSSVPFDHVRLYNPTSLDLLLRRHGFVDISIATPGRLDVEMVQREYEKGGIDLRARPELEFMLEAADNSIRTRFQGFLAATLRSSHMRCVARR